MIDGAKEMLERIAFHRSMTFEERRAWAYSKKDEWDLYAVTETAKKKGRAEGRAEGEAIGREEGLAEGEVIGIEKRNLQIAKKMKADGMPVDVILKYTGLTAEETNSL